MVADNVTRNDLILTDILSGSHQITHRCRRYRYAQGEGGPFVAVPDALVCNF